MSRLLLALLCGLPLAAQTGSLLSVDDLVQDWKISKQFTIAVAEKMPAESYDFKATPEEMTFGEQMLHIATAQLFRFRQISGQEVHLGAPPKKITKDVALDWLNQSFDYVFAVLPKMTDEQLYNKKFKVDWNGRSEVTGREMALAMFVHTAHHRAQCEVYLRLKGIAPPTYTF